MKKHILLLALIISVSVNAQVDNPPCKFYSLSEVIEKDSGTIIETETTFAFSKEDDFAAIISKSYITMRGRRSEPMKTTSARTYTYDAKTGIGMLLHDSPTERIEIPFKIVDGFLYRTDMNIDKQYKPLCL